MKLFRKKTDETETAQSNQDLESIVFKNKVALREIEKKSLAMYDREITAARELQAKGLKSKSNYEKIGLLNNVLKTIAIVRSRLNDITDQTQINEIMGGMAGILSSINSIGKNGGLSELSGVISGLESMNAAAAKESEKSHAQYSKLNDIVQNNTDSSIKTGYDESFIEKLIAGSATGTEGLMYDDITPVNVHAEKDTVKTEKAENERPASFEEKVEDLDKLLEGL